MEKNRIDKKIKETLEDRRIFPSDGAWNRIEAQLEGVQHSSKTTFWRFGIAAGFIGILMIPVLLMNTDVHHGTAAEEVVATDTQTPAEDQVTEDVSPLAKTVKLALSPPPGTEDDNELARVNPEGMLAMETDAEVTEMIAEDLDDAVIPLEKLDLKVAEVVSQIASLENAGRQVEDKVIDSLLRVAQVQLMKDRIGTSSEKVDAMALLSDVEDDLNRSFRDQLFEKLKEGYLKVRTAVAYRND